MASIVTPSRQFFFKPFCGYHRAFELRCQGLVNATSGRQVLTLAQPCKVWVCVNGYVWKAVAPEHPLGWVSVHASNASNSSSGLLYRHVYLPQLPRQRHLLCSDLKTKLVRPWHAAFQHIKESGEAFHGEWRGDMCHLLRGKKRTFVVFYLRVISKAWCCRGQTSSSLLGPVWTHVLRQLCRDPWQSTQMGRIKGFLYCQV